MAVSEGSDKSAPLEAKACGWSGALPSGDCGASNFAFFLTVALIWALESGVSLGTLGGRLPYSRGHPR